MKIPSLSKVLICSFAANLGLSALGFGQPIEADLQSGSKSDKNNPYIAGINRSFQILLSTQADLDFDGSSETIIGYRETATNNPEGGLLILSSRFDATAIEWHVFFENAFPEKIQIDRDRLIVQIRHQTEDQKHTIKKTFRAGKDFRFRSHKNNAFEGIGIQASSTLDNSNHAPANVFDRKLNTSWAENADGTGSGEKIVFDFKKPLNLGLIGILHGKYPGNKAWRDNNRLHRAEITMETVSDRAEIDNEIDLDANLGLGLYGDQAELRFTNQPILHFFKLKKKQVVSLEIEITSVLLGNHTDDAHISEVDFAEMLSVSELLNEQSEHPDPATQR